MPAFAESVEIAIATTYKGEVTQATAWIYCASFTVGLWGSVHAMGMMRSPKKILVLPALLCHLLLFTDQLVETVKYR